MQSPIQAPPMPRLFMQDVVGNGWDPRVSAADRPEEPLAAEGRRRKKKLPVNPCLVQLTTFAARRRGR